MFIVGDKVRPLDNPIDLEDYDGIGTFRYPDWDNEFTIDSIDDGTGFIRLIEDDGRWWWHSEWLLPSKKIRIGGE